MATEFYCEICGAPMVLDHQFKTRKKPGTMYRVRRFKCTLCDFAETIFGDGTGDKKDIPGQAIEMVNDMYKQEERNRNYGKEG